MNENIKVGDEVQIVDDDGCCGLRYLGAFGRVEKIEMTYYPKYFVRLNFDEALICCNRAEIKLVNFKPSVGDEVRIGRRREDNGTGMVRTKSDFGEVGRIKDINDFGGLVYTVWRDTSYLGMFRVDELESAGEDRCEKEDFDIIAKREIKKQIERKWLREELEEQKEIKENARTADSDSSKEINRLERILLGV